LSHFAKEEAKKSSQLEGGYRCSTIIARMEPESEIIVPIDGLHPVVAVVAQLRAEYDPSAKAGVPPHVPQQAGYVRLMARTSQSKMHAPTNDVNNLPISP
jgi:hypothetical protein